MNKIAHYLQEHLVGEILTSSDVCNHFSTDASIFQVTPSLVAYPKNENDVRKIARFTWQLAERGRVVPITARGKGSDRSGGAIGSGVIVEFPAHMNKIIELDGKSGNIVVEPGLNYGRLQQTLHTHGRFLPAYPSSLDFSTIGGAIANNASGEKSAKYGDTRKYVKGLRVVLANGEVIETKRLSKRELSKKMGLSSFEGEIYRNLDKLIEENKQVIEQINIDVSSNSAGYEIASVKLKNSFDLTPLLVGSQGTLALVTEASLSTELHSPHSTLIVAFLNSIESLHSLTQDLSKLSDKPSMVELVDQNFLSFVNTQNPNQLKGVVGSPLPKFGLLIELDLYNERSRKKQSKKVVKLLNKYGAEYQLETSPEEKEKLYKLVNSKATVLSYNQDGKKALPIIDDACIPLNRIADYFSKVYELFTNYKLKFVVWGHLMTGNFNVQPFFDISQIGDRQKMFKIMNLYYEFVIDMGGTTGGSKNDGRLRGSFLQKLYGNQANELFNKIKAIFDPYGTLNPGVKVNTTLEAVKPLLRDDYTLNNFYDFILKD